MGLKSKKDSLPAFAYPKQKHRRGPAPGPFSTYRKYKPYLRNEFSGACVYCRVRDSINRERLFAVEHYLPQSHFQTKITEWDNLFYACQTCNGAKGSFFPRGKRKKIEYIPNPCADVMFDHLRYQGPTVVPHSETGEFTAELLDLNDPSSVEYREYFQRVLEEATLKVTEAQKLINDIERGILSAVGIELSRLTEGLTQASALLDLHRKHLLYITGAYLP